MAQPPEDLSDLLDTLNDAAPGRGEELLSQLAGESIDRMMSGEYEPIVNPVAKLTDQLGSFFEELQQRRDQMRSVAPRSAGSTLVASAPGVVPEEQIEVLHADERDALDATGLAYVVDQDGGEAAEPNTARAMLVADDGYETSAFGRTLDWIGGPVAAMSSAGRVAISLTAVASFVLACASLAYVLVLRSAG